MSFGRLGLAAVFGAALLLAGCRAGGLNAGVTERPAPATDYHSELSRQARPAAVPPAQWTELGAVLGRTLDATKAASAVPHVPLDSASKVSDLQVAGLPGGPATVSFSYRNSGDYDQNGRVGVEDLSVVGIYLNAKAGDAKWPQAQLADGDANGVVNVADVTPIGLHFLQTIDGYELQSAVPADAPVWTLVQDVPYTKVLDPGGQRRFSFDLDTTTDNTLYRVVPFLDGESGRSYGIPSTTVLLATLHLEAPLAFSASQGTESGHITLSWKPVSGASGYLLYRDSQDTPLTSIGAFDNYEDKTVPDGAPHSYWLRASAGTLRSNFSAETSGWLGQPVGSQAAATGLTASDGTHAEHIALSWTQASGASRYEVYRDTQHTLIATLGDVASYEDRSVADVYAHTYWIVALGLDGTRSAPSTSDTGYLGAVPDGSYVVFAYNDVGLNMISQDFSELMLAPPGNKLHATVIDRVDGNPQLVTKGVSVRYSMNANTYSAGKTNFWDFAPQLFGHPFAPDTGVSGKGLSGEMQALGGERSDWLASGIPVTPVNDQGQEDPYGLATVSVFKDGLEVASTQTSVPVSWEVNCAICHTNGVTSVATDILQKHDNLHGTDLLHSRPVNCGTCHAQPQLGEAGTPGVPSLSSSMHSAHSSRMWQAGLTIECNACHAGQQNLYLRDIHAAQGLTCYDCHGGMDEVGLATRRPWLDEPRCDSCHMVADHQYEQPGKLYNDSVGHSGVQCAACHGSPHAIVPTVEANDNVQNIALQGHPGMINSCSVCHAHLADGRFTHRYTNDGPIIGAPVR